MYKVEIAAIAALELAEAHDWYEGQRRGLGEDLLCEFERLRSRLAQNPLMYPVVEGKTRRAVVQRFPYGIFYVVGSHRVVITAFLHGKRDPRHLTR